MTTPHTFIALYRGNSIGEARLIAASADPDLIQMATRHMLHEQNADHPDDPITEALQEGRRKALRLIGGQNE
jgi:hypothetical protein